VLPVIPPADRPEPVLRAPDPAEHPAGVRHWGEMLPVRWTLQRDDAGTAATWWRGATGTEFG
jgi:hypothetical protein